MTKLVIKKPDDWHLHLRDGELLKAVLPESERHFNRALVMPNLVPPITTVAQAIKYKDQILNLLPKGSGFKPLMTLYLTEDTSISEVKLGVEKDVITAIKLYPAGATTNSSSGVNNFEKIKPVLEYMAKVGLPLCIHGEVTDRNVDIFDREAVFIEKILNPLRNDIPGLKTVIEHITTKMAVDYVRSENSDLAATITTHHLVINRNDILVGGIKPHYYCLPIAKREHHRLALLEAATSGETSFFLGTDSAPHVNTAKESACGCAGCFTATNSIPILAHIFEEQAALNKLEAFISINGATFYNLEPNKSFLTLSKGNPHISPSTISTIEGDITIFDPGYELYWQVL